MMITPPPRRSYGVQYCRTGDDLSTCRSQPYLDEPEPPSPPPPPIAQISAAQYEAVTPLATGVESIFARGATTVSLLTSSFWPTTATSRRGGEQVSIRTPPPKKNRPSVPANLRHRDKEFGTPKNSIEKKKQTHQMGPLNEATQATMTHGPPRRGRHRGRHRPRAAWQRR